MTTIPRVAPKSAMDIAKRIAIALKKEYGDDYHAQHDYIMRWHAEQSFKLFTYIDHDLDEKIVNVYTTLNRMDGELLFKIAIDLKLELPGVIYSVAEIKELLTDKHADVGKIFERAIQMVHSDPTGAITALNNALELLIKNICAAENLTACNPKQPLKKLLSHILKQLELMPYKNMDPTLQCISSSLIKIVEAIADTRNDQVHASGKELIEDPLYAMLVVNAVATVGLFLLNYANKYFPTPPTPVMSDDEIPF